MERKCKSQTISIPENVKNSKEYKEILKNANYIELIKNKEKTNKTSNHF